MKSQDSQEKKFRQLSDQELEKVTGGVKIPGSSRVTVICLESDGGCPVGEIYTSVDGKCQCVPMPNTVRRVR